MREIRPLSDPCFGLPLRLQAACAGQTLWAYNPGHLAYLKAYVQADLRRRPDNRLHMTMVERLPSWLKQGRHRAEVLRGIERLEQVLIG
ncbi:hypothetical protein [Actinoplanes solisilvae]|uniref:hypothetical protein n=1 Tax=Actinoplanes solisilvae TaxID=2486853 RepID=UPI000FD90ABE|nr:hypothetical protein [Actinoplanes solisilvae]